MSYVPSRTKNSKQENPVFGSPDGVRIQINRGGNKMQFIRDLCRNKEITDIQFRILVPLVDTSNEGIDNDRSRWGKSWLSLEALALESGCSKKAVQENIPKLEEAGIVKVTRDLDSKGRSKGGRSKVNEYWLTGWNRFGAVSDDEENGERDSNKQGAWLLETGNAAPINGERRALDSTHLHNPDRHNPTDSHSASRRGGPAGSDADGGAANDNAKPVDVEKFWKHFPVRKNVEATHRAIRGLIAAGENFDDICGSADRYADEELKGEVQFCKNPVVWLQDQPWKGQKAPPKPKFRMAGAI